jgi:D-alanyl-D-alanine carboxypeptidase
MNWVFKFAGWIVSLALLLLFIFWPQPTQPEKEIWPEQHLPIRKWNVPAPKIDAQGAIIAYLSPETKILWENGGTDKYAIASITKLVTAMVTIDKYDLNHEIETDIWKTDSMIMGGQTYTVGSLLRALLIGSSNVAAENLVSDIQEMNKKAQEIGLENTAFVDSSGLLNNHSTPRELVTIASYLIENYPELLEIMKEETYTPCSTAGVCWPAINTNLLITNGLIGKTGTTNEAGECLLVIDQKDDYTIIAVVLHANNRFQQIQKLLTWAQEAYIYDRIHN